MQTSQLIELYDQIENCKYTNNYLKSQFGYDHKALHSYIVGNRKPRKKTLEKLKEVNVFTKNKPKIRKRPSYGYATDEQIEKLKTIGLGLERDLILKAIKEQTARKGKSK